MSTAEPPMPTFRSTLLGAACLAAQPLLLNALSVPALALIIRRLGAEGYAQWSTAVALVGLLTVVANPGLRAAFVRDLASRPARAPELLAEQLGLRVSLAALAGALALTMAWALGYPAAVVWCVAVGSVGLVLTCVATTLGDLLQSVHRNTALASVNLAAGLSLTAVSAAVALMDARPVAMAAAYLSGPFLSAAVLGIFVQRTICDVRLRWGLRRGAALLLASRHFAAQQLLFAGSAQAEGLIAPRLLGMQTFGCFTAGSVLGSRLGVLPDSLCAAAYPAMVRACGRGAGGGLVRRYLLVAIAGGIAVTIVGCALAAPLGRLLLPAHAEVFATVARVTIWTVPLLGLELVLGYALNAAGGDKVQARLALPAAAVGLAVSASLMWAFGLTGVCWSMVSRPAIRAAFLIPAVARAFSAAPAAALRFPIPLRRAG
jgi:O-antigen/teichoic acid export membrane protein